MKQIAFFISFAAMLCLTSIGAEPRLQGSEVVSSPAGKAAGDLLYWNGSTWVRLILGSQGQVLTVGTNRVFFAPVTIDGSGNMYVGTLTSTGAVTATSFTTTGSPTDANISLPDDDASHKLTFQANNTTTTDINKVAAAAPIAGIHKSSITDTTNENDALAVEWTDYAGIDFTSSTLTSDDTYKGFIRSGRNNSGGVTQWDAVYMNGSSQWVVADANGSGTYPVRGIATATATTGNATTVITRGTIRNDAWTWTPGGTIYLSTTAGGLTQTAPSTSGDKVQVIGYALDADTMAVEISPDYGTAP